MRKLKRKLQIVFTTLFKETTLSREERCLMIITKKLLLQKGSELLLNPQWEKFYIKSEDGNILVTIDVLNKNASVINHHFGYDLKIGNRVLNYIHNNFFYELEKRRILMEEEYKGNIQYSLSNVIHKL